MFKKITREKIGRFIEKYQTKEIVLDIGAGGSSYGKYFPNRISVDIDKDRNPDIVADAHALPFKDSEYSFIICTEVLEHLKKPSVAISEMHRVLKSGGTLILTTRFIYPIHDSPGDYWRFTKYGLEELFKEWDILTIDHETEIFSSIAVLLQRLIFQVNFRFNKVVKLALLVLGVFIKKLDFLVAQEYGDIRKEIKEKNIITSGYFLVCRKR